MRIVHGNTNYEDEGLCGPGIHLGVLAFEFVYLVRVSVSLHGYHTPAETLKWPIGFSDCSTDLYLTAYERSVAISNQHEIVQLAWGSCFGRLSVVFCCQYQENYRRKVCCRWYIWFSDWVITRWTFEAQRVSSKKFAYSLAAEISLGKNILRNELTGRKMSEVMSLATETRPVEVMTMLDLRSFKWCNSVLSNSWKQTLNKRRVIPIGPLTMTRSARRSDSKNLRESDVLTRQHIAHEMRPPLGMYLFTFEDSKNPAFET